MEHAIPDRYTRGSIMDMLPDTITDEEMSAMRRYVQREGVGLVECKCAECGKEFIAHREHRYRYETKGKILMYCSHRCFRVMERKDEEAWRKRIMGAWTERREKTPVERAQERVAYVQKRLDAAMAETFKPEWNTISGTRRGQINGRITHWRAQLVLAETELEEAMASEAGQPV
ncbi:MAG: hypothetical protein IJ313_05920 [Clostridia bacterium]|nr:hypothetical protein [Clostridia bacterium]